MQLVQKTCRQGRTRGCLYFSLQWPHVCSGLGVGDEHWEPAVEPDDEDSVSVEDIVNAWERICNRTSGIIDPQINTATKAALFRRTQLLVFYLLIDTFLRL